MDPQALAVLATLISFAPHGNRIDLKLDRGSAEMVWISARTFHFRRSLEGPLPAAQAPDSDKEAVALQVDDTPAAVHVRSKYLDVAIQKHGLLINVHRIDGAPLMSDLSEPKADGQQVTWERSAPAGVHYYGLGASTDPELDLRGKSVDALVPFLFSTAGYGETVSSGTRFDFTKAGRYEIRANAVDYYFYYGPTPKEVFNERVKEPSPGALVGTRRPPAWETLRDTLLEGVHQAMSTPLARTFDLSAFVNAPEELKQRARQLGSMFPVVTQGTVSVSPLRGQLTSFFDIYEIEKRDHGHPIWHALPFQFPDDPESAHHADEFMLGDELLIAPIYESGTKRQVYLPPGSWTSLETNLEQPGRQTITVDTKALPVFARNGTIVPLDSDGGIGMHYFPKAGGEFFLVEKEVGAYTQLHAAPAGDAMRLEINSKKERDYQWVVHHVEQPAEVGFEAQKYQPVTTLKALADRTWLYDPTQKNLIIRAHVKANEDCIINLTW